MKFDTSRFIFIVKGLLVGATVGIVVSLFRLLIEKFLVLIKFLFMQAHNNSIYFIILAIIMLVSLIANSKFIKDEPKKFKETKLAAIAAAKEVVQTNGEKL